MKHSEKSTAMDIREIVQLLPHRFPFLLVDRVLEIDRDKRFIRAIKNVSINEAFFQGHFPDVPVMPGVLILEALAQTGALYVNHPESKNKLALLMSINNAKFRQPVKPGDVLHLTCEEQHMSSKGGKIIGHAKIEDRLAAEAEFGFVFVDKEQI